MKINLPYLPQRDDKPRRNGLTMVMDKGLSIRDAENMIQVSGHLVDYVKLGFGTSMVSNGVKEKVKLYAGEGIRTYLGGTLFEAFVVRDMLDEYRKMIDELGIDTVEVSDGSMHMEHNRKCELIHNLSRYYHVISEVGSKEASVIISPSRWIKMMSAELEAGAVKVIAEARESGNVGIYRPNGNAHVVLINRILEKVPGESIIWEAPNKPQQVWFIKLLGANVNLGNIAPNEVIPLETLRLGLRGDTFFEHLPEKLHPDL
jgi:phosphosulfolactate synthase